MRMAKDGPYDLMPHREIVELKKQIQELRSKRDETSSDELLDSINALTKSMDAMLKLFSEAAEELKVEGNGGTDMTSISKKLDKIIEQNRAITEMIGNLAGKREKPLLHKPIPRPDFQPPQGLSPNSQQPLRFEPQVNEPKLPELDELPPSQQFDQPPRPQQQGPVAMPSVPFSSIKEPKKKGLFGRLKK